MDLEAGPNNNLKYRRNFCQAIFGLVHHLRRYVTWTADDLSEFTDALHAQRVVDERYWQ